MALSLDDKIIRLQRFFEENGKTLALAESCTGGLLAASIAALPGVSKFFKGGVVSYDAAVKENILQVPRTIIKAMGEVSLPTAMAMARAAKKQLNSDWAVGITGVAGPSGGTPDKPVGFVCFAVVGPGFEEARHVQFTAGDRRRIQLDSVHFALDFLWDSTHS